MAAKGFGKRALQARLDMAAKRGSTLTQLELAAAMGVSGVTIGAWETDAVRPDSLEKVERLAALLQVSPCWLAFGLGGDEGEGQGAVKLNPKPRTRDRSRDEKGDKHA